MTEHASTRVSPPLPARASRKVARAIALYLPQYHPIPENDQWWGPGFTEWTNVARARPLFRGHEQPHIPADLSFYDLRLPETREAQAALAREAGIEAFCYWHYWFAGKRLLERPFNEVLKSGQPRFGFCLGWANHSWTGVWYGAPGRVLIEQTYPGLEDHKRHFETCLGPAFADGRYLRVDSKPLLVIFRPKELPESRRVLDLWRALSDRNGLGGLHAVAHLDDEDDPWDITAAGYDAAVVGNIKTLFSSRQLPLRRLIRRRMSRYRIFQRLVGVDRSPIHVVPYDQLVERLVIKRALPYEYYPCVVPNWDNTPRSGARGSVATGSTPERYEAHLAEAVKRVSILPAERRIIVIKSWNEWAEGNYLEPDQRNGMAYLTATRQVLVSS